MLIKYLSKSLFLKTVLVFLGLAIALTLYPFAKNLNLASDQDTDSCSNILYFPTINSSRDWQTTVSITNTECKSKQRRAKVTLTAYDKDGLSLGIVKNVTRLRGNKTKTINAQTLPSGTESLKVESDGSLIANAIFRTIDGRKSEVVPAIKESSKQLDFPALASYDDLYIYETITLLNPNTTFASIDILALDKDGYEIDRNALPSLSSMESKTFSLVDIFGPKTLRDLSTVRVISDSAIVGLQLVDYPDVDLVGLPALTTTSKVWTSPIATQGENLDLWTKVGILNTGNDIASIMVEAFNASNRSLGIVYNQKLFPGATYSLSTLNANIEDGVIPLNTAFLKVTSDQPVSGYELISVVNGKGITAVLGIPEEDHDTVGVEVTGSNDGEVLNAYSMVRMRDRSVKSTNGSFGDIKVAKRLLIAKHEKNVSITSTSPFPGDKTISSVKDCKKFFSGWDEDCLLEELRDEAYFGISYDDVSDTQLLKYIEKNKNTIATLLLQIDYGRNVQSFIHNNGKVPIENKEGKIFLKTLKGATSFIKTLGDILNLIEEIPAWNAVSESVNVFGKILDGYKIYIKAKEVFTKEYIYNPLWDYIDIRKKQSSPDAEAAWKILKEDYKDYGYLERASKASGITMGRLPAWFENAYVAYRMVKYDDSASIRYAQGEAIAKLAKEFPTPTPTVTAISTPTPQSTVTPEPTLTPTPIPTQILKIVFGTKRDGNENEEVYSMDIDGSNQLNLTNNPSADDGTPSFSPDQKYIVFGSERDGNWEVYKMNSDGSDQTNITNDSADDGWPTWSPNGDKIMFLSDRAGIGRQVYLIDTDGQDVERIAEDYIAAHAAWSPDAKSIVFASDSDEDGDREIYILNLETKEIIKLTDNSDYDDYPAWSPDGKYIVFASDRESHNSNILDLFITNISGKGTEKLIISSGDERYPAWVPDGRLVLTIADNYNKNNTREIYISEEEIKFGKEISPKENLKQLTLNEAEDNHPMLITPLLSTTPAVTSFKINNDASSTTSRTVTLNNTATGSPTQYMASESSSFSAASWQTYSTAPSFTLSSGNGTKTVYFKVKNSADIESAVVSDSIILSVSCTYSINPTTQSFGSSVGSGSVSVTTQSGCNWTAVSNNTSWITITSGSSGSGNGTVYYSVAANSSASSRTGTMTIAGKTFTVTQSGTSCTYSISPTSKSFDSGGGSESVTVTTQSGCNWTATSNASWITISSGSSGTGSGTVNYSVSANTSTSSRTGTITITGGNTFTVTQDGTGGGALPDLTSSATVASSYTSGQTGVQIPVTVSRSGGNLTSGSYVHAKLYWSTDSTWDTGDSILWSSNDSKPDFPNSVLNSNGSKTVTATIDIPSVSAGTYYIISYADAPTSSYTSGYHSESNEDNNTSVYNVSISKPSNESPKAGFTMKAQGKTAYENETLNLTVASGQTVSVSFSASRSSDSDGSIASYKWSINGTEVSTSRDFSYSLGEGTHQIYLEVLDNQGASDAVGASIIITSNPPPTAAFTMTAQGKTAYENETLNLTVASGQTVSVSFSASRSSDSDGSIASYKWSINGTEVSTSRDFSYDLGSGTHQIYLEVWDNLDAQGSVGATIIITTSGITVASPNGGESWQAGTTQTISWTYTSSFGDYVKIELLKGGSANSTISTSTSIGSGGSGSYSWTISSSQTAGSDYKVRVTSTSNSTYTDTSDSNFAITAVTTNQSPTVGFTMTAQGKTAYENETLNLTVASGQTVSVSFSASRSSDSDGSIASYKWSINGTEVSTSRDFSYDLGSGTHQIYLEVWDNLSSKSAVGATVSITSVSVSYQGHFANTSWGSWVNNGATCGTPGGNQMEAIKITTSSYGIQYRAHVADYGWLSWVSNGAEAGTTGESKSLQAIEIKLTNAPSNLHVSYRGYVHGQGWQGWVSDGSTAGTTGQGLAVEAIEIKLENW